MVVSIILTLSMVPDALGGQGDRPFWTEKSSFVEGEDLFVVGVASRAKTVEEGRKQAFENGRQELMNFAQVTNLEARGLVIETQMTYEEPNPDGTVTVYRLLRVPAAKLVAIQGQLQEQAHAQAQALDKALVNLRAMQESVARKQRELETQNRQVQDTLTSVARLQETLGQKAARIEQKQREVEQLLGQLSLKVHDSALSSAGNMGTSPRKQDVVPERLLEKLKETEAQLDAQDQQLSELGKRAKQRLAQENERRLVLQRKCKHVEPGMTKDEVKAILGDPTEIKYEYGTLFRYVHMDQQGRSEFISVGFSKFNGLAVALAGCHEKEFSPLSIGKRSGAKR